MTRKKKLIWIGAGLLLAGLAALFAFSGDEADEATTPTFTVAEGPLTIGITSSGSIQSKDKVTLKSELEGHNTIIWVVEEGVNVKAGDLLVEFDAAALTPAQREALVGEKRVKHGFSALTRAENAALFPNAREATLEEIMVHLEKEETSC